MPHLNHISENDVKKRQKREGKFGIWRTGGFKVLLLYRSNCMKFFLLLFVTTATLPHAAYTEFIMLNRAGTDPGAAVALFGHSKLQHFLPLGN